jgi:hypothetical protein
VSTRLGHFDGQRITSETNNRFRILARRATSNHPVAAAAGCPAGVRTSASTASLPAGDRFIVRQRSTVNVDPAKADRCTSTRSAAPASPTGPARLDLMAVGADGAT